jgi:hypothetical protein
LKITKKREGEGIVPSLPFGNIQITQILVKSLMMCLDKEFVARICGLDFLISMFGFTTEEFKNLHKGN